MNVVTGLDTLLAHVRVLDKTRPFGPVSSLTDKNAQALVGVLGVWLIELLATMARNLPEFIDGKGGKDDNSHEALAKACEIMYRASCLVEFYTGKSFDRTVGDFPMLSLIMLGTEYAATHTVPMPVPDTPEPEPRAPEKVLWCFEGWAKDIVN